MLVTKLSSKGQLVIPKKIREALGLQPGTEFNVELVGKEIVLRPVMDEAELITIIQALRELAQNTDFLADLEADRQWELQREHLREEQLFAG